MKTIPKNARQIFFESKLLKLVNEGKVRMSYELIEHPELLLVIVTDRISIFDFILGVLIPLKGYILNLISTYWKLYFFKSKRVRMDLVAWGSQIDDYLPEELRGNHDLWLRATVVRKCEMIKYEMIFRDYLTGSALEPYYENRPLCGHTLPAGLYDGSQLPQTLFTPSTKAEEGHDKHVSFKDVLHYYPQSETFGRVLFDGIKSQLEPLGLLLVDTKFEYGMDSSRNCILCDEAGSPDSSRIWEKTAWKLAQQETPPKSPTGFDKQFVREYGKQLKINDTKMYDPEKIDDQEKVGNLAIDSVVCRKTTHLYLGLFEKMRPLFDNLYDPTFDAMVKLFVKEANRITK